MVLAREETQHNSTAHIWCEVIAGVVAVAFLVGCLEVWRWRWRGADDEGRDEEVACCSERARGTPFNSPHTPWPKQAKLAQRRPMSLGAVSHVSRQRGHCGSNRVHTWYLKPHHQLHLSPVHHSPVVPASCRSQPSLVNTSRRATTYILRIPSDHLTSQTLQPPLLSCFNPPHNSLINLTTHQPTSKMAEHNYKFNITMTCGGCSGAVERVLKKLEGESVLPVHV